MRPLDHEAVRFGTYSLGGAKKISPACPTPQPNNQSRRQLRAVQKKRRYRSEANKESCYPPVLLRFTADDAWRNRAGARCEQD